MRNSLCRLGICAVLAAFVATATAAPLAALGTGTGSIGGDGSHRAESNPVPSPPGSIISVQTVQIIPGRVFPEADVPPDEWLSEGDIIRFSASFDGTGGGPMHGGGQCEAGHVELTTDVLLPVVMPYMDPPPVYTGGLGGVVNVPTWFWAILIGDQRPESTQSQDYTTCSSSTSTDPVTHVTGTWWSPHTVTATIHLATAPTGQSRWNFGDGDVSGSCSDKAVGDTTGLGLAEQSNISHTYCFSSIRTPHTDGYPVFIQVDFLAAFSVNGQVAQTQPVFTRNIRRYPVREVEAVLDE